MMALFGGIDLNNKHVLHLKCSVSKIIYLAVLLDCECPFLNKHFIYLFGCVLDRLGVYSIEDKNSLQGIVKPTTSRSEFQQAKVSPYRNDYDRTSSQCFSAIQMLIHQYSGTSVISAKTPH